MAPLSASTLAGSAVLSLLWGRGVAAGDTLCAWDRPQGGLIRDTIYIDGGSQSTQGASVVGVAHVNSTDNPFIFTLNLTQSFNIDPSVNVSSAFDMIPKDPGTTGPNAKGGHFLANDYEFMLYGGLDQNTDKRAHLHDDSVLAMNLFKHGQLPLTDSGKLDVRTLEPVTRNVAEGAYVSAPSENLGFVFSGTRNQNWSQILQDATVPESEANVLSNQLITVDLTNMDGETWSNTTIPRNVPPRAGAELVWIPAGKKGTLVAIGGTNLNYNLSASFDTLSDSEIKNITSIGKTLVSTVSLYDVDAKKWYTQETSNDIPPPMSFFCSTVATSQDNSTHHIYVYGGRSGTDTEFHDIPNDDVYVLSIPSFSWRKVYTGQDANARFGHLCHKVADNQMMVIGGVPQGGFDQLMCIPPGTFIRVFDLNALTWLDKYDPAQGNMKYKIPSVITKDIGGSETGGSSEVPSSWTSDGLSDVLSTKYPGTIKNYWPYPSVKASSTNSSDPSSSSSASTSSSTPGSNGSSLPTYVPPLLGAILGLLVVISILCGVLLFLRRRRNKQKRLQSDSAASTVKRNRRTWSWIMGTYGDEKPDQPEFEDPTTGTMGTETANPFDSGTVYTGTTYGGSPPHELKNPIESGGNPLHEMPTGFGAHELPGRRVTYADEVHEIGGTPISPEMRHPTNYS